jgi:hypothetical protein
MAMTNMPEYTLPNGEPNMDPYYISEEEERRMDQETKDTENQARNERLMEFYDVLNVDDLVRVMEEHIGRLQSKMPKSAETFAAPTVREG